MQLPIHILWRLFWTYRIRWTPRRIGNLLLLTLSWGLSCLLRRPIVWGSPALLMVEPTNLCNLRCPLCPSGDGTLARPRGRMDLVLFKKILDEVGETLILIQFWNQGEPFLHPHFLEMVRLAKAKGIGVITSTNGHFLDLADAILQSGLDELIVSIDGLDQATYATYRVGGNLERVIRGIREIAHLKRLHRMRRPILHLQFLVMRHNEAQIPAFLAFAQQVGAEIVQLKSVQIYTTEQGRRFLPRDDRFSRYHLGDSGFRLAPRNRNGCRFLWFGAVVNWDGRLSPCCFDKDARYPYAVLFSNGEGVSRAFRNRASLHFRRQILRDREAIPICRNCFEGLKKDYTRYLDVTDLQAAHVSEEILEER